MFLVLIKTKAMKKIFKSILLAFLILLAGSVNAQSHRSKGGSSKSKSSGSGYYKGGKGSSHKGGHYKNASTGNHYRKRK